MAALEVSHMSLPLRQKRVNMLGRGRVLVITGACVFVF